MKVAAISGLVALAIGVAVRHFSSADVAGVIMLGLLVFLPLLGWMVTIDNAADFRMWREWECWAEVLVRASYPGIGFAIDFGWRSSVSTIPWLIGAIGIVSTVFLHRRIDRLSAHRND